MAFFCLTITVIVYLLFLLSEKSIKQKQISSFLMIIGIIVLTLFIGLRDNPDIDIDFQSYQQIILQGSSHYYYEHIELLPRLYINIIHNFGLPYFWWFIMMAFSLSLPFLILAKKTDVHKISIVYLGFIFLYFSFSMNCVRQGVAMMYFLCAVTYLQENYRKYFILFLIIAFCFHKSSILWSVLLLLSYFRLDSFKSKKIFIFILITALFCLSLSFAISNISHILTYIGYGDKINNAIAQTKDIEIGSGLGILFRYIRWLLLLIFIPIISEHYNKRFLMQLYLIFIIGMCLDIVTMRTIILNRIALYPQMVELLLYPYLIDYTAKLSKGRFLIIRPVLFIQFLILVFSISKYFSAWNFQTLHII